MKLLKKLKANQSIKKNFKKLEHLVIGSSFSEISLAYLFYKKAEENDQNPREKIGLIHNTVLAKNNKTFFMDIGLLRGKENIEVMEKVFSDAIDKNLYDGPKFLKDQNFRSFKSRIKPTNVINPEEEFFKKSQIYVDYKKLLPASLESMIGDLCHIETKTEIKNIVFNQEDDEYPWQIECDTGDIFWSKYLYFGQNLKSFYSKLEKKINWSSRFHQFFQKIESKYLLTVQYETDQIITGEKGTVFIPQCISQERGHFIGNFPMNDQSERPFSFSFFTFLKDNEESTEEISKKIKLLKKIIKRVFPKFDKSQVEESIVVTNETPLDFKWDELYRGISKELRNCFFMGYQVPLSTDILKENGLEHVNQIKISNMARHFLSYQSVVQNFNLDQNQL